MNINIKNLKSTHLDVYSYINDRVDINSPDISSELETFYQELLNIEEALFYKKEKLKKSVEEEKKGSVTDIINPLLIKFNKMKLEPLKNIEKILNLTQEIEELKNTYKILSIISEIDKKSFATLENLYNSEDAEDWKFFAELIIACEERREKSEVSDAIITYSKKMEDKLNMEFKKASMEQNIMNMRDAYVPMNKLKRTRSVIKNFINNLSVIKEEIKIEKLNLKIIDLEFFEHEENSFHLLIKNIKKFYQKEIIEYENVFDNFQDVLKKINQKIYDEKISKALEIFLNEEDPILYLLLLKDCFIQVESLNSFISTLYPQIVNESIFDIFESYLPLGAKKESEAFDKIFSILVYKKKSDKEYLILGKNISSKLETFKIYKILLSAFNFSIIRSEIFHYEEDDIFIITKRYIKRTMEYLREVTQGKNNFEIINLYFNVFIITRKYFSNSKIFCYFEYFLDEISKKIDVIAETLLTESNRTLRHMIRSQSLSEYNNTKNTTTMKKIVDNLQSLINNSKKYIKDKNSTAFLSKVFEYTISYLNSFYLTLNFSKEKAKVLINDIEYLSDFFRNNEIFNFYEKTKELKSNFIILTLEADTLENYIKSLDISFNEAKKILKCRNDYSNVKFVLSLI